jgi:hypothetical protein
VVLSVIAGFWLLRKMIGSTALAAVDEEELTVTCSGSARRYCPDRLRTASPLTQTEEVPRTLRLIMVTPR